MAAAGAGVPELVHFCQQVYIVGGDIQTVKRVEHLSEAGHGFVACLRGGYDHEATVNVGLLVPKSVCMLGEGVMVSVGSVFGVVKVALGIVELFLEQAVLGGDGGQ